MGNQVSAEFNLLYRFHPIISERDEKWLEDFLKGQVFKGLEKPLSELNPKELLTGLLKFETSISDDPKVREFAHFKRDKNGKFDDAQLAEELKKSIEEPAGMSRPKYSELHPNVWQVSLAQGWCQKPCVL